MSAYAELAVTTNFSFLRGASDPEELVGQAHRLGLAGIGIADRNSVAGVVRAHVKARTIVEEGGRIKLALGARLVFADGTPDILAYPRDRAAWGRLTRMLSLGKRRAEKGDCILTLDDLLGHIEGLNLIVLPGRLGRRASSDRGERLVALLTQLSAAASRRSVWLAAAMLYRGDDGRRLARLAAIAGAAGVPLIAVNDVLYHEPERRALQDVVTCIREHTTLEGAGRKLEANAERHIKSACRNGAAVPPGAGGDRRDAALPRRLQVLARRIARHRIRRRDAGGLRHAAGCVGRPSQKQDCGDASRTARRRASGMRSRKSCASSASSATRRSSSPSTRSSNSRARRPRRSCARGAARRPIR